MALTGTAGQPVIDDDEACTVNVNKLVGFPCIFHWMVAVLLPPVGVASGFGEEKVIVDGVIVGPLTVVAANVAFATITATTICLQRITESPVRSPKS
jgi:uncharacterized membrane protein YqaE (UPF0057 family)